MMMVMIMMILMMMMMMMIDFYSALSPRFKGVIYKIQLGFLSCDVSARSEVKKGGACIPRMKASVSSLFSVIFYFMRERAAASAE